MYRRQTCRQNLNVRFVSITTKLSASTARVQTQTLKDCRGRSRHCRSAKLEVVMGNQGLANPRCSLRPPTISRTLHRKETCYRARIVRSKVPEREMVIVRDTNYQTGNKWVPSQGWTAPGDVSLGTVRDMFYLETWLEIPTMNHSKLHTKTLTDGPRKLLESSNR